MFGLNTLTFYGVVAAVVAALFAGTYIKGHSDGSASVQAKWDSAIAKNITDAVTGREDVDRAVPLDPPARELCDDQWNRNRC